MKKSIIRLCLLSLLAAGISGTSVQTRAQDTNKPSAGTRELHRKPGVLPFHGNLKAVDATARTITVRDQTIQITSETKIEKGGKPAILSDGVIGEPVSGGYRKNADGKLDATMVRFGVKEAKTAKKTAASEESK